QTVEEIKRQAQAQLTNFMRSVSRFEVVLDVFAPEITVPSLSEGFQSTKLVLNLGHLFLNSRAQPNHASTSTTTSDLYMKFHAKLENVSACFQIVNASARLGYQPAATESHTLKSIPVLEDCTFVSSIEQIWVPQPDFPTLRISARAPSLEVHFSPEILHCLLRSAEALRGCDSQTASVVPWESADYKGCIHVLIRQGISSTEFAWQKRVGAVAGPFLYILPLENSRSYKQRISLRNKILLCLTQNGTSGLENALVICPPGCTEEKAVRTSTAMFFKPDFAVAYEAWKSILLSAIHRASDAALSQLSEVSSLGSQHQPHVRPADSVAVFFVGEMGTLRMTLHGKNRHLPDVHSVTETPLVVLEASNAVVETTLLENSDLILGAALSSLEVKDLVSCDAGPACRFLARSSEMLRTPSMPKDWSLNKEETSEVFHDANELSFPTHPSQETSGHRSSLWSMSEYYDALDFPVDGGDKPLTTDEVPSLESRPALLDRPWKRSSAFVQVQYIMRVPDSPEFSGVNAELMLDLSGLSFYCNRPTVLALIGASLDMAAVPCFAPEPAKSQPGSAADPSSLPVKAEIAEKKETALFRLNLCVGDLRITLNGDNGLPLAVLTKQKLMFQLQVCASSFLLDAELGQLRICDLSLGEGHEYGLMFSPRSSEGQSFAKIMLTSSSISSNGGGSEYSLSVQTSEIRVVYLNRFIQEVTSYLSGLSPPPEEDTELVLHSPESVKDPSAHAVDATITPIKLAVLFGELLLLLPESSASENYLEFDVGRLEISNSIEVLKLLGDGKSIHDVSLDVMKVEIDGIRLHAMTKGHVTDNMIERLVGLQVFIERPLGDPTGLLPGCHISVKVGHLQGGMCSAEYATVLDCVSGNFSEMPRTISVSTAARDSTPVASMTPLKHVDVKSSVHIQSLALLLYEGSSREATFAKLQVSNLTIRHFLHSGGISQLFLSIFQVFIKDLTSGVAAEERWVLGIVDDMERVMSTVGSESASSAEWPTHLSLLPCESSGAEHIHPSLPMLILESQFTGDVQCMSLRIQRPRLLLAPPFISHLSSFFTRSEDVEAVSAAVPRWEDAFHLHTPYTLQQTPGVLEISSQKPLVADAPGVSSFTFDGNGGSIELLTAGLTEATAAEAFLIIVGPGKHLRFKNVHIYGAEWLACVVKLGVRSSYSVDEADGVKLLPMRPKDRPSQQLDKPKSPQHVPEPSSGHWKFNLQAIGLELIAIDQARWAAIQLSSPENLLRLKASLYLSIQTVRGMSEVNIAVRSSGISTGSGLCLIEPVDSRMRFTSPTGYTDIQFSVSDLHTHFTFNTLELILRMQEKYMSSVYSVAENPRHLCLQFKKVWAYADKKSEARVFCLPSGSQACIVVPPETSSLHPSPEQNRIVQRGCILAFGIGELQIPKELISNAEELVCSVSLASAIDVNGFQCTQHARTSMKVPASAGNSWLVSWNEVFLFEGTLEEGETVCVAVERSAFTGLVLFSFTWAAKPGVNMAEIEYSTHTNSTTGHSWLSSNLEPVSGDHGTAHLSVFHQFGKIGADGRLEPLDEVPDLPIQEQWQPFQMSLTKDGPWAPINSVYGGGVVSKQLGGTVLAVQVSMVEGEKHLNVRSLVTVVNKTEATLEVCLCPRSLLSQSSIDEHSSTTVHAAVSERARQGAAMTFCNLLPEPITLSIWSSDPPSTEVLLKENGLVLEPGAKKGILSVHPMGHLLVCLKIRDSWVPREESEERMTIFHPQEPLPSEVTLMHKDTHRHLQVSIDRTWSTTFGTLKEVVFSVPCWVDTAGCPPLVLSLSHGSSVAAIASGSFKRAWTEHKWDGKTSMNLLRSQSSKDEVVHVGTEGRSTLMLSRCDDTSVIRFALVSSGGVEEYGPDLSIAAVQSQSTMCNSQATAADGSYLPLVAFMDVSPFGSQATKVLKVRPLLTLTNRLGERVFVRPPGAEEHIMELAPSDWHKPLVYPRAFGTDTFQIRTSLSTWSYPLKLSVDAEVIAVVRLLRDNSLHFIRIDARSGGATSKHIISFRFGGLHLPFKLENHSSHTVCFRQSGLPVTAWEVVLPKSAVAFAWEDPGGNNFLEAFACTHEESTGDSLESRAHPPGSMLYDLSEPGDLASLPLPAAGGCLHVQSFDCDSVRIIRFMKRGGMAGEEEQQQQQRDGEVAAPAGSTFERQQSANAVNKGSRMEISLDLMSVGLSIIDQRPQELLYAFSEGFLLNYRHDGQDDSSRLKLILKSLRIDNQLPLSPLPVLLFLEQKGMPEKDYVFKFLVSSRGSMKQDEVCYPKLTLWLAQEPWQVNVHEAIVWRLWELMESICWEHFFAPESAGADGGAVAAVQFDPMIRIDHLVVSGAHLKLTLEAAPTSRPAQLLGSWSSLVTAAGNTKRMPVRLSGATAESRRLRRSIFMEAVVRHVLRDLLHQSLRLLSGVDVLGVISSTLTALGHGASRLVHKEDMSNRHFQQALGNQLDNVGEGLLYGAEAMAKGVALGVANVLVRSRSGYETHGPPGLLLGLSKGLAGLVVHPVTGCLHSLAFLVAGVDASTASCARMVQRKPQLQRLRLPRAISADGVVHEYSKDSAVGQMVLFLAEAGSYFGKHDIFRDHSKFALSDAYVNHILLPNCRILLITSRRVMMLKCPVDPAGQPDSLALVQGPSLVRWDVPWDNLLALETKSIPSFPRPVVCVHMREPTPQRLYTIIRCPESHPAEHVLADIASAFETYGPKPVNIEAAQDPKETPHHSFLSAASSRSSLSLTTSPARPIQPTQSRRFVRQHSVRTSEAALAIGLRALSSSESNPLTMARPLALASSASRPLPSHVETDTFIRAWVVEDGPSFCFSSCQRDASEAGHFAIWKPVPPEGFTSLGDVAWRGLTPPPAVRVHSITPSSLAAGSASAFAMPKDYFL
ncbi:unnamed protein product, partial [Closterium sp. NIES-53]